MKQTRHKSAEQQKREEEQRAAKKRAEANAAWHRAAQKTGEGVRHTFVRLAKETHGCEWSEAENMFEAAVKAGKIVEVRRGGMLGDVPIYMAKK